MRHPTLELGSRFVALLLLMATLGIGPVSQGAPRQASVTISGGTDAEQAMTHWAVSRFAAAGLDLPNLTVSFHDDLGACDGYLGIYRTGKGHLSICNRGGRPTDPRHTVLHELAHMWSFTKLSPADTERFKDHRGLEHWQGGDSWWQQGAEQLAEVVVWGLQDPSDPFRSVWTHTEQCADLAEEYRMVTGAEPLNAGAFCLS